MYKVISQTTEDGFTIYIVYNTVTKKDVAQFDTREEALAYLLGK